jgi:hypothetical protein
MTWAYMEMMMPNSKQIDVKRKHRKRKARQKNKTTERRMNAKRSNIGSWILSGVPFSK